MLNTRNQSCESGCGRIRNISQHSNDISTSMRNMGSDYPYRILGLAGPRNRWSSSPGCWAECRMQVWQLCNLIPVVLFMIMSFIFKIVDVFCCFEHICTTGKVKDLKDIILETTWSFWISMLNTNFKNLVPWTYCKNWPLIVNCFLANSSIFLKMWSKLFGK